MIRGEIEPREKAEATYKEALYSMRTAGFLEQDRADTFRQRLGSMPPPGLGTGPGTPPPTRAERQPEMVRTKEMAGRADLPPEE